MKNFWQILTICFKTNETSETKRKFWKKKILQKKKKFFEKKKNIFENNETF